jgi:hypothetical protein
MSKGVTIDLIVDPKGAIEGLDTASSKASGATSLFSDLGKVGAAAMAAVGTAVVGVATGLTAATVSAGKYADEILTAATNTNLSTDTLQAYKYAAEQIDVSFETFTASQGKFTKSMQTATAGTGPAAEAFSALGLSVTDSSGNLADSETLYWSAIDALSGVTNETERTALAQQIFGKSGAEMNSIIAKGSAGFAELTAQAQANGAIMSGPQLAALGAFDDKMAGLTSTVDSAKNALGLTLLPILDDLAGQGTSALGEFTTGLLAADGDLSKAGPTFEKLGDNLIGGLATAVPKILGVATSLVSGLISGIVTQAPQLIQTAIPLIVSLATGILGMLPALLEAGVKIVISLVQGIATAIPQLIPAALDALFGLQDAILDNLPLLITTGIELLLGLALGLVNAIPDLIARIPVIISSLIESIVGAIPQLVMAGVQLFLAVIQNLPAIIGGIIGAVPVIIKALIDTFGDPKFWKQMGDAGLQLIKGLWEGIKGAGDWLWKQLSGFFGGIIDNIRNLLGIHSPSTVTGEMGDNLILGLVNRIRAGMGLVSSVMGDLSRQVTDGFDGSLSVRARASVTGTNGGTAGEMSPASTVTPVVNQNVYVLPEQDARIVGRQFGREFAREMAST